ncbi:MAG: FadR family transcriptional regulator [Acidobacteriota bacterium]|nr:FadR family transcriptional regulator [Acidobacteriota bacterium]
MDTLKPVTRTTLSEQVALQIAERISGGRWAAGQKLPPESALCKTFHVGRSTLREALKSLAFIGLVRMRAGEGTFVAEGPSRFLKHILTQGLLSNEKDVTELCEARILLETELAAICSQRASDQNLASLDQIVVRMGEAIRESGKAFLELDLEFHLRIAEYSQNGVLAQLLRTIRGLLHEVIEKSSQIPGSQTLALEQHRKILEALLQRDERKSRAAMRDHLKTFERGYKIIVGAAEAEAAPVLNDLLAK